MEKKLFLVRGSPSTASHRREDNLSCDGRAGRFSYVDVCVDTREDRKVAFFIVLEVLRFGDVLQVRQDCRTISSF